LAVAQLFDGSGSSFRVARAWCDDGHDFAETLRRGFSQGRPVRAICAFSWTRTCQDGEADLA
jgi:hypothetical protein